MPTKLSVPSRIQDLPNVQSDFGAAGDGVADDSNALVAALATKQSSLLPNGVYNVQASALIATTNGQRLVAVPGGKQSSNPSAATWPGAVIRRIPGSNGPLITAAGISGGAKLDGFGLHHVALHGSNGTGELLNTDFSVHGVLEDVWFMYNGDSGCKGQESWDWTAVRPQWEWCSGSVTGTECLVLANSSIDSTNAWTLYDPRFESFKSGFVNLSGNGFNLHSFKIEGGKAETAVARGDMFKMTADVRNIRIRDMYLAVDSFDAGYSTPVNVFQAKAFADLQVSGCRIRQNAAGLIRAAFACNLGAGGAHAFRDNIFDNSAGDPTVGMFAFDGGTGDFDRENNRYQATTSLSVVVPDPLP
jgi:hypothetical protein